MFTEQLKRYHISPLQYDNGLYLNEEDYKILYSLLQAYFVSQENVKHIKSPGMNCDEITRVKRNEMSRIIKSSVEDLMDEILDIKKELVL